MPHSVLIIGGGLAGLAASAALTSCGWHTTIIDRRPLLGGRATSIPDAESDQLLDNCQHVLLGCCTNLLHLYDQLGKADSITFHDTIHFCDAHGHQSRMYATALPSPAHLSWSLLKFGLLNASQKAEIARAMLAIKLLGRTGRDALSNTTFASWLKSQQQSDATIDQFWDVIITSALNEHAATASAYYGLQVFQEAFLGPRTGYRMGVANVPLSQLYDKPIATQVRLSTRIQQILYDTALNRITGVQMLSGETLRADAVILATAPDAAVRMLSTLPPMHNIANRLITMEQAPIIGAHLFYDRPVMQLPHLALIGTTLQWLFRKDTAGTHIHGVISAAQDLVATDQTALSAQFDQEVRQLLPDAREAKLLRSIIIKEKRATFRPLPGIDHLRPTQKTPIRNLALAGDYTQTGWPGTMEGAVRSGYRAAQALTGQSFEQPDLS